MRGWSSNPPGTGDPETKATLETAFATAGIGPERLRILPPAPEAQDHLALYNEIDVALDPFPYNGTTTTCEALWMGVPVITLAGDRHAGRVGASLLGAIGFAAGIAATPEDYVLTARLLASQPELLATAGAICAPTWRARRSATIPATPGRSSRPIARSGRSAARSPES